MFDVCTVEPGAVMATWVGVWGYCCCCGGRRSRAEPTLDGAEGRNEGVVGVAADVWYIGTHWVVYTGGIYRLSLK